MAANEEIWLPPKVHNHDKKFAYRSDDQRQDMEMRSQIHMA